MTNIWHRAVFQTAEHGWFFFGNTDQSFCVAARGMYGNTVACWMLSDPDED